MIFDQLDFKEEKVMDNEKIEKLQQMIDESDHIVFFVVHKYCDSILFLLDQVHKFS